MQGARDSRTTDAQGQPRRALAVAAVMAATVGCDHATKRVALETLRDAPPQVLLDGLVRLHYVENPGAFLSLGAELPSGWRFALFTLGGLLLLALLLRLLLAAGRLRGVEVGAAALLAGGGLSNLLDRLLRDGRVVDFVQLAAGPLHTGIFNLADVAISAGALALFWSLGFGPRRDPAA